MLGFGTISDATLKLTASMFWWECVTSLRSKRSYENVHQTGQTLLLYLCGLVADILIVMSGIYLLLKMYSMLEKHGAIQ